MKKYLTVLLGLSLTFAAWADPRIEMHDDGHICHLPLDANNAGDEMKIGAPACRAVAVEIGTEVDAACICRFEGVPADVLDDISWNATDWKPSTGLVLKAKYSYPNPGNCNVFADGTWYASQNWKSRVKYFVAQELLEIKLRCFDGT